MRLELFSYDSKCKARSRRRLLDWFGGIVDDHDIFRYRARLVPTGLSHTGWVLDSLVLALLLLLLSQHGRQAPLSCCAETRICGKGGLDCVNFDSCVEDSARSSPRLQGKSL